MEEQELQVAETTENTETAPETVESAATEQPTEVQEQKREEDPLPKGVRKSIDRLTRQRYQAEARAEMLEKRLAELEQNRNPQRTESAPQDITLESVGGDWEKYIEAKAEQVAAKKFAAVQQANAQQMQQQRAMTQQQQAVASFQAEVQKAQEAYPDFADVLADTDAPMTDVMQRAILRSGQQAPDIAYYLARNPDVADKIARMHPEDQYDAVRDLRAIAKRPTSAPKQQSKASAPVGSVTARGTVQKDPSKMSDAEWHKWNQSQKSKS